MDTIILSKVDKHYGYGSFGQSSKFVASDDLLALTHVSRRTFSDEACSLNSTKRECRR
jgi:hypothetical protein